MASKEDLGKLNIVWLAVLCQRVADNSAVSTNLAEKAAKLKQEWVLLVARETPHGSDFKTHAKIQGENAALKARMVELLTIV
jgi:hypothetical protein